MRGLVLLTLLFATHVRGHPQCFYSDTSPNEDYTFSYCPDEMNTDGSCCNEVQEALSLERVDAYILMGDECHDLYQQVVCGVCHSYSGHLYERLGDELGGLDGLTMKNDFCQKLVSACEGLITFPTYDGEDYCTKHTGGGDDLYWSYPYEESEIFDGGLTEVFAEEAIPEQIMAVRQTPDSSAFWLAGQAGEVRAVDASDLTTWSTVVDISSLGLVVSYEEGLLSFAFGPMFGVSGYPSNFYLSYTTQLDDGEMPRNRLSKFQYVAGDPASTLASEEILLTSTPKLTDDHSGGWTGFKPSAYGAAATYHDLYWSMGDGGFQHDPDNIAQDTSTLHGSIIRISVPSDGTGYEVPTGNLASPALPEICANGFRNPFRCGFDRDTDDLYCGDVGQDSVEEIDLIECGNNYGWSRLEGNRCQDTNEDIFGECLGADRSAFTPPIFEYCHADYVNTVEDDADLVAGVDICGEGLVTGSAVIGGTVYRGTILNDLLGGAYIFADWQLSTLHYIKLEGGEWQPGTIYSGVDIVGFSETNDGELMIIGRSTNTIYYLPCGDLCATTCLDQAEEMPTFDSLGCFADVVGDRAMEIDQSQACGDGEEAMSPAICASYCSTIGATYAGVQFGHECFCGSSEDYSRHGTSTDCTMTCESNPTESCGGNLAIEVFELGSPVAAETNLFLTAADAEAMANESVTSADESASSRMSSSGSTMMIVPFLVGLILTSWITG